MDISIINNINLNNNIIKFKHDFIYIYYKEPYILIN